MSLTKIRDLQVDWFGDHKSPSELARNLDQAFDGIGFTESYVNEAIARARTGAQRTKVIKDNVWGMIEIDEPTIRLLDSPIIQRLRRIRQLGFSYLTYPSAEHSRFVHSLGMLGVVTRFIDSANRTPKQPAGHPFQPHEVPLSDRYDLVHAALLHDAGHLPFSHASEFAFEALAGTRVGTLPLSDFFDAPESRGLVRRPKLAEIISAAIVLSRRFGRYYTEYVRAEEQLPDAINDGPLRIASYVLGRPTDNLRIGYAELISGRVIDADKLDYVNRDGLACGIPIGIDVGRLFLRSGFLKVEKDELNRLRGRSGLEFVDTDQVHFIVNSAGQDTIEELIAAKTSLYHRVYFHQTTRNAERLYEKVIESAIDLGPEGDDLDVLKVWASNDEQFLAKLSASSNSTVRQLALRLTGRQLPKRAAVFGQGELASLFPFKKVFPKGGFSYDEAPLKLPHLQRLSKLRIFGMELQKLEREIAEECVRLQKLVHDDFDNRSQLGRDLPPPLVLISPVQFSPPVHDDSLVLQNRELVYSKELHNVTQTNDAEEVFQAAGYVLTDDPWRELAFIAARKVLIERTSQWTEVEVRVDEQTSSMSADGQGSSTTKAGRENALKSPRSEQSPVLFTARAFSSLTLDQEKVVRRTNINRVQLQRIEDHAARRGYFDPNPLLTSKPEISNWPLLHSRFSEFEGQYGWKISRELVEAFVWQFPPALRPSCLNLLERIDVLDRQTTAVLVRNALEIFYRRPKVARKVKIAPLSPNSGQEVRIALEERFRANGNFRRAFDIYHSLEELLVTERQEDYAIALIDDNVVSGSQAFCQLSTWMGIDRKRWPVELQRETNVDTAPLSDQSKLHFANRLSHGAVGLCVAIGSVGRSSPRLSHFAKLLHAKANEQAVEETAQSKLFADLSPFKIEVVAGKDLESHVVDASADKSLVSFLDGVGQSLLALDNFGKEFDDLEPLEKQTCKENSLGYENARGLTLTFRNVPVSTVTCIWLPGKYRNRPWVPLAVRRGYGQRICVG